MLLPAPTDVATSRLSIDTRSLHASLPILKGNYRGNVTEIIGPHLPQQRPHGAAIELKYPQGVPAGKKVIGGPVIKRNILNLEDRKSTRLNSSHVAISYACFCFKQ